MADRDYRIRFGASHSEAYEVEMIKALQARGHVVEPLAMSAVVGLPTPGPVAPATVAPAASPLMPPPPFPGAEVKVPDSGNGFKAWDSEARTTWLFNADGRPMQDGTSGANRWKTNIGGRGAYAQWVGIDQRPALVARVQGQPAAKPTTKRGRFPRA